MRGSMVALVGTSSVGKSSVAEQLQPLLHDPHLVVGIDLFLNMFPQHWAKHARGPGPGMWYVISTDPDGRPRTRIRYGVAGARLLAGMRAAVRALLDSGNHVILDEMPLDETILPAWNRELAGYDVSWIRLHAPLDVVEAREAVRTRGQQLGNARGHYEITSQGTYDLEVDVATISAADAARRIASWLPSEPRRIALT